MFPDHFACIASPLSCLRHGNASLQPATDRNVPQVIGAVALLYEASFMQFVIPGLAAVPDNDLTGAVAENGSGIN